MTEFRRVLFRSELAQWHYLQAADLYEEALAVKVPTTLLSPRTECDWDCRYGFADMWKLAYILIACDLRNIRAWYCGLGE